MKKTEQVDGNIIVYDYDENLQINEICNILREDFDIKTKKNPFICELNHKTIKLFVKQITYLGNPHSLFKKRIQISRGWNKYLEDSNAFLLGIYKYKETIIYTFFDKSNFIKRNTNNSSAHVSTFDLFNASQYGIFTKKDIRGNRIICIKRENIKDFLIQIINNEDLSRKEISLFEEFKNTLKKHYCGIDCFEEMISNNYRNKFQPEWFGFFIEYKFECFLNSNHNYKSICCFQSNKSKNDIDLDLNFNNKFLGDLKTHSNNSNAILGNDFSNIKRALRDYGKLWYIVFNHNTILDREKNFEVTQFWNKKQNKKNIFSYSKKMKHSVILTDLMILEINQYNFKYTSKFNQGINSNKLRREPKIKIDKKMINNFLIYKSDF